MSQIKATGGIKVSGSLRAGRFNEPPAWDTIEGSLGTPFENQAFTVTPGATDPDSFPSGGDVDYSLTSGSLPSGLTLNAETGEISGTPTAVGSDTLSNFTLRAEDGPIGANLVGKSVERDFNITVIDDNPPNVSPAAGSIGSVAELTAAALVQITATDPNTVTQSITFSEVGANLTTENLSIDSNGNITGTPPDSGGTRTLNFTVRASTATNSTDVAYSISITDNQDPVWITAAGLLATVNESEAITTITLAATDDNAVSYSVTSGALPGGLTLNSSNGEITGTPSNVAEDTTSDFEVTATDTVELDFTARCFQIKVLNVIANSLRLDVNTNDGLKQTLVAGDSSRKMTFSTWAKRGTLSAGTSGFTFLSAQRAAAANGFYVEFEDTSDVITITDRNSGATTNLFKRTTAKFRDPSAWYHIVVIIDTTNATTEDRVKLYVNGVRITDFSANTNYPLNEDLAFLNKAQVHDIGGENDAALTRGNGYLAEHIFIDGLALAETDFGAFDSNGDWQPKEYSGSFGTNGWHLDFAVAPGTGNGAGTDVSGNNNHWTDVNLTANDQVTDSPTNNYATLSPLSILVSPTLSDGNLNFVGSGTGSVSLSGFGLTSGKWYWEYTINNTLSGEIGAVLRTSFTRGVGYNPTSGAVNTDAGLVETIATATTNDVIAFALNLDDFEVDIYKNGSKIGGPYALDSSNIPLFPAASDANSVFDTTVNFGQQAFADTPPSGFVALNTANLPTPTIANPSDQYDTVLYTGDGNNNRSVTGLDFQPDLVWIKNRSNANSHQLYDAVRGVNSKLSSDDASVESTGLGEFTSFDSGGFTLGTADDRQNTIGFSYVAWCWNESATPGFDIVSYTGTGVARTVNHSLSAVPDLMIVKNRDVAKNWIVYHSSNTSAPETDILQLDLTAATVDDNIFWNDTAPTSTQFTVGTAGSVNDNMDNYITYLWTGIEGFSKFGGYTGNGSADGPFVWCGFRPAYILLKSTDVTSGWEIWDSARSPQNVLDERLNANSAAAESTAFAPVDLLSNGFKLRDATNNWNGSSNSYVFAAFAESPFKTARSR